MQNTRSEATRTIEAAYGKLMSGDLSQAEALLGSLSAHDLGYQRRVALSGAGRPGPAPGEGGVRPSIPGSLKRLVFERDSYTCRYCELRTISLEALQELSVAFPGTFPYQSHWKFGVCHIAYWTNSASIDHRVPVCRGGSSDLENLVTACYQCNEAKAGTEVAVVALRDPRPDWDGLAGRSRALAL